MIMGEKVQVFLKYILLEIYFWIFLVKFFFISVGFFNINLEISEVNLSILCDDLCI